MHPVGRTIPDFPFVSRERAWLKIGKILSDS